MKRGLPLYDADAEIACTIDASEVSDRVAVFERMRTNLKQLERTADGMALHFDPDPAIEDDLRRFVVDEKRCCQFFGFAVDATGDDLKLQWDAPPDAQPMIDHIARALQSDEPITRLSGLL